MTYELMALIYVYLMGSLLIFCFTVYGDVPWYVKLSAVAFWPILVPFAIPSILRA